MDQAEERESIKRVLDGERGSYKLLVEAYKKQIFNLALRMTGSCSDADDLTQETFIQAYRQLPKFRMEKKYFTWLYTISLNLIRNHLRKKAREETILKDDGLTLAMNAQCVNTDACSEDAMINLEKNLLKLPFDVREAILLKFYHDLSFEETADVTGHSVSAVKMRVYRGLEKLKKWMENEE